MNIKSKFNDKEIALLEELNIEIKADYNNDDLQNLENSVYNAMMDNLDEKQDFTPRAEEIEHILDVIVEMENNWGNEKMKILNKLNEREKELLNKIDINIEDRDYYSDELEEIKENIVLNGEISNLDEQGTTNDLAMEYSNLADKFIQFEDETEK